jgi:hypothetical protein
LLRLATFLPASANSQIFKFNAFFAFCLHNLFYHIEESNVDNVDWENELKETYRHIQDCKTIFVGRCPKFELMPHDTLLYTFLELGYNHKNEPEKADVFNELAISVRDIDKAEYYACLSEYEHHDNIRPPALFLEFWDFHNQGKIKASPDILNQTRDEIFSFELDWLHHWFNAREAFMHDDMDKALTSYELLFSTSKYRAGIYFLRVFAEVCAFCKTYYQSKPDRYKKVEADTRYENLGSAISSWASVVGHTGRSFRDPNTMMPFSPDKFKNGINQNLIEETRKKMEQYRHRNKSAETISDTQIDKE